MKMTHTIPVTPWRASSTWSIRFSTALPLVFGLTLFGIGEGLLVQSHLGATPWTVFAQGLCKHSPLSIGWATFCISTAVLLLWIPLKERPGFGTLANIAIIALMLDVTTLVVPAPHLLVWRFVFIVLAIAVIGFGTSLYITTGLGPGPRDGLMTSLHRRTGVSVVYVRLTIEGTVLVIGYLLGGTVGIGTAAFALLIGFSIGLNLQLLSKLTSRYHHG